MKRMSFIKLLISIVIISSSTITVKSETSKKRCSLWIDLYHGEPISFEELLDDLSSVHVIYLGEAHTIKRHHTTQQRIIEELCKRGKSVAIALEQMEAHFQNELDRYNNGNIDFNELAKRTGWGSRWSNYREYESIIETARRYGVPVIAANAVDKIIKKIARKGITGLSKDDRSHLPEHIELNDPMYEKLLNRILRVHRFVSHRNIRFIYEAQVSRDEMMAYIISRYLKDSKDKGTIVVVIGGTRHFAHGLGVPSRVRRREPDIKDRIVLLSESGDLVLTEHEKHISRKITITHQDLHFLKVPIADYIHITEPAR